MITTAIAKRKDRSKKIRQANNAIIDYLRSYVVDNGLPSKKIIDTVITSTCREFDIHSNEIMTDVQVCEELVKEIIGNVYVTNESKTKYITDLERYLSEKTINIISGNANMVSSGHEHINLEPKRADIATVNRKQRWKLKFWDMLVRLVSWKENRVSFMSAIISLLVAIFGFLVKFFIK